jgi:deazaflavin-dependent oxidoreductase (nitroreductase family)
VVDVKLERGLASFGASAFGLFVIKHLVSPIQRRLLGLTGGRISLTGSAPVLLLTTIGRRTGEARTVPVFYLNDGSMIVLCNVRPPGERTNPWVLNLLHDPEVLLQLRGRRIAGSARVASSAEVAQYWPRLVEVWPAYQRFAEAGGERRIFVVTLQEPGSEAE